MAIIKIKVENDKALTVKKRDAAIAMRKEFELIGQTWHRKHRPRHFTLYGANLYGYEKRKTGYNRRKRKRVGHTLPLVYSGVSKRLSATKTIRATRSRASGGYGVRITMPVRVFNFKTRHSTVDKRKEFQTIADSEIDQYEKTAARNLERKIDRFHKQTVRYG